MECLDRWSGFCQVAMLIHTDMPERCWDEVAVLMFEPFEAKEVITRDYVCGYFESHQISPGATIMILRNASPTISSPIFIPSSSPTSRRLMSWPQSVPQKMQRQRSTKVLNIRARRENSDELASFILPEMTVNESREHVADAE